MRGNLTLFGKRFFTAVIVLAILLSAAPAAVFAFVEPDPPEDHTNSLSLSIYTGSKEKYVEEDETEDEDIPSYLDPEASAADVGSDATADHDDSQPEAADTISDDMKEESETEDEDIPSYLDPDASAEDAGTDDWQNQITNIDFTTISDAQSTELDQALTGMTSAQFNAWMTEVLSEENDEKLQAAINWLKKYGYLSTSCADPDSLAQRTFYPPSSSNWTWPSYIPTPVYGSLSSISQAADTTQITLYTTETSFAQLTAAAASSGIWKEYDTDEVRENVKGAIEKNLGPGSKTAADIFADSNTAITHESGYQRVDEEGWALFAFGGGNTAVLTVTQTGTKAALDELAAKSSAAIGDSSKSGEANKATGEENKITTEAIVTENEIGLYTTNSTGETTNITLSKGQAGAASLTALGIYYDAKMSDTEKQKVLDYIESLDETNLTKILALYESYMTVDEYNAFIQFLRTGEKFGMRMFADDVGTSGDSKKGGEDVKISAETIVTDYDIGLYTTNSTGETNTVMLNKAQAGAASLTALGIYYDAKMSDTEKQKVLDYIESLDETNLTKILALYESYMTVDEYNAFIQFLRTGEKFGMRMFADDVGTSGDSSKSGEENKITTEAIVSENEIGLYTTTGTGETNTVTLNKAQAGAASLAALGIYYDAKMSDTEKQKVLDYIESLDETNLTKILALYESYMTADEYNAFIQFLRTGEKFGMRMFADDVGTSGDSNKGGEDVKISAETIVTDYDIGLYTTNSTGETNTVTLNKAQAGAASLAALGIYYDAKMSDTEKQKVLDYIESLDETNLTKILALYESYMTADEYNAFIQFLRTGEKFGMRIFADDVGTSGDSSISGEENNTVTEVLVRSFNDYLVMSSDELQAYIGRFSGLSVGEVRAFFQGLENQQYSMETIQEFGNLLLDNGVPVPADYVNTSGTSGN